MWYVLVRGNHLARKAMTDNSAAAAEPKSPTAFARILGRIFCPLLGDDCGGAIQSHKWLQSPNALFFLSISADVMQVYSTVGNYCLWVLAITAPAFIFLLVLILIRKPGRNYLAVPMAAAFILSLFFRSSRFGASGLRVDGDRGHQRVVQ